mgnify:FL=1
MDITEVKTEKELFSNEDNKKILLERYGDMESVMFAVHNLKQKEAEGPINIFDFMENYSPNNVYTDKEKFKNRYSGEIDFSNKKDLDITNMMYQKLKEESTKNGKSFNEEYRGVQNEDGNPIRLISDQNLGMIDLNLIQYANQVNPLKREDTLSRGDAIPDIYRYQKNLKNRKVMKRYSTADVATHFGIDFGTDQVVTNEASYRSGFAEEASEKLTIAQNWLNEHYADTLAEQGESNVTLTIDDMTGEYVFKNPTTGKFQLLDNPNSLGEEYRAMIGPGIPIVADIAGMVITNGILGPLALGKLGNNLNNAYKASKFTQASVGFGKMTGTIMLNTMGSGLGYAVGDLYRKAVKEVYLNPDLSDEQIMEQFKIKYAEEAKVLSIPFVNKLNDLLFESGGIDTGYDKPGDIKVPFNSEAALMTAMFDTVFKSLGIVRTLMRGEKLGADEFGRLTKNVDEGNALAKSLNDDVAKLKDKYKLDDAIPDANPLSFSIASTSKHPELNAYAQALADSPKIGKQDEFYKQSVDLHRQIDNLYSTYTMGVNKKTIDDVIDIKGGSILDQAPLGKKIKKTLDDYLDIPKRKEMDRIKAANDNLYNANRGIASSSDTLAEAELRKPLQRLLDNFYDDMKSQYTTLDKIATIKNVGKVRSSNINATYKRLKKADEKAIVELPSFTTFFKTNKGSIRDLSFKELKDMRTDLLLLQRNSADVTARGTPIKDMLKAIDDDMKLFARQGSAQEQVFREYVQIGVKYKEGKNLYGKVLGKVLKKQGDEYTLAGEDVFKTTFKKKGTDGYLRNINDVKMLTSNPANKDFSVAYLNDLGKFYKQNVFKSKKITLRDGSVIEKEGFDSASHKKFMDDYGDQIKILYPDTHKKLFSSAENKMKAFDDTVNSYNDLIKKLSASSEGKISKLDSEEIINTLWNKEKPEQFKKIVKIIKDASKGKKGADDTYSDLKGAILRKIRRESTLDVVDADVKFFDPFKFSQTITENKGLLNEVFSKEQVSFLTDFNKALDMAAGSPSKGILGQRSKELSQMGAEQITIGALRSLFFRPLSPSGVMFTNVLNNYSSHVQSKMADILLEPNAEQQFKELARLFKAGKVDIAKKHLVRMLGLPSTIVGIKEQIKEDNQDLKSKTYREKLQDLDDSEVLNKIYNSKLSQAPINVATSENKAPVNQAMAMAPSQGPVNPQGIAALSTDQGPRATGSTNVATVDKMKDYGMEFLA